MMVRERTADGTLVSLPEGLGSGAKAGIALKVVVGGPFNAGKSQFIRTVSDKAPLFTEARVTDGFRAIKKRTTVAMDFGVVRLSDRVSLYLFGTPGQRRFDFMWEILGKEMDGYVLLADSSRPEDLAQMREILKTFDSRYRVPFVVVANKQDRPRALRPEEVRRQLGLGPQAAVLPCVATDRDSVQRVLAALSRSILSFTT